MITAIPVVGIAAIEVEHLRFTEVVVLDENTIEWVGNMLCPCFGGVADNNYDPREWYIDGHNHNLRIPRDPYTWHDADNQHLRFGTYLTA